MGMLLYDDTNIASIVKYAQQLENKTVDSVNYEQHSYGGMHQDVPNVRTMQNKNNKGGFGNFLEEAYFGKKNDNKSRPDFPAAKLELKASPLKMLSNCEIKVKERLVLNHFTFCDIDKENFDTSHFKEKNENLLIVFYHYDNNIPYGDLKIHLADIWSCLKEDEFQIRQDWETIIAKIHAGKAHEISEGDTLYLGACTKGATAESSMQTQPHSEIKARGRAFCFKLGYINHIFQILSQRKMHRTELERRILAPNEIFENKIQSLYAPYIGKFAEEICRMLGRNYNPKDKSRYANIARSIIGLNKSETNLYEFNAADIQFKTIRVEPDGKSKESMSFKHIDFCEIVSEDWEESYFYSAITSKFVLILFKRDFSDSEYYLDRILFWQVPVEDYPEFEKVWTDTRDKIRCGDYEHFIKIRDNPVSHVRPHAKNASDVIITPQNTYEKKKCFWINQEYIQKKILDTIYK